MSKSVKKTIRNNKQKVECRLSRRTMNFGECLWLWLFYPAIVLKGDGIMEGTKVRLYFKPEVDGGFVYWPLIDYWITVVVYLARLFWMKFTSCPGPTRDPRESRCNPNIHDRWEFFAINCGREEILIYPENRCHFDSAISLSVWFWLSIFRQPEIIADKFWRFDDVYERLFNQRRDALRRWYKQKEGLSLTLKQAFSNTELHIMNSDLDGWKKQIGLGISSTRDLPLPIRTASYE